MKQINLSVEKFILIIMKTPQMKSENKLLLI